MRQHFLRHLTATLIILSFCNTARAQIDFLDPSDPNATFVDIVHASSSFSDFVDLWQKHQWIVSINFITDSKYRFDVLIPILGALTGVPDPQMASNIPINQILADAEFNREVRWWINDVNNRTPFGYVGDDPNSVWDWLDYSDPYFIPGNPDEMYAGDPDFPNFPEVPSALNSEVPNPY